MLPRRRGVGCIAALCAASLCAEHSVRMSCTSAAGCLPLLSPAQLISAPLLWPADTPAVSGGGSRRSEFPISILHSLARPARVAASSAARGAAVLWALVSGCMRRQQCRWRPSLSPLNLTSSLLFCSGLRTLPLFPAVAAAGQSSPPPSFHSLRRHRAMPACRRAPRARRYSSAVSRRQQ